MADEDIQSEAIALTENVQSNLEHNEDSHNGNNGNIDDTNHHTPKSHNGYDMEIRSRKNSNKQQQTPEDDDDDDNKSEEDRGGNSSNVMSHDDDPMHVDFNEDQWLPCIPKLSLTGATMLAAILGIAIGLAISLSPPNTIEVETTETVTRNMTITDISDLNNTTNIDITDMKIINGEFVVYYEITRNVTEEEPYSHLNVYAYAVVEFPGKIWVSALKLLVLPLITMMMISLPSRVDEIGPMGKIAIPLYLLTSTCAAIQGTAWAWIIQPGNVGSQNADVLGGETVDTESGEEVLITDAIFNVLYNAVPENIVTAMSELTVLGIIVFFLGIGILLRHSNVKEEERKAILNVSHGILRCCMLAIVWVVWFTPIGMLSLICLKIAATADLINLLAALGMYLLCVAVGHTIHTFIFYPVLFWLTTRLNGWLYYFKIYPAAVVAFATSSSMATLPRSLTVAENAGVRKDILSFILPLGAAINMDGTALGFPIMIGLIAQLNDVPLDFGKIIVVLILSIIISVGTAPIPNVGMVYLTMLFEAAGIGHLAGEGIATLFVLDWLVDRIETTVNVTSDQYVAKMTDVLDLRRKSKKEKTCCWFFMPSPDERKGAYQPTDTEMDPM